MSKKKYLFFDIDGTLAAGGYENFYIPDSAKLAIDKLKKAGHFLCIPSYDGILLSWLVFIL